MARLGKVLEPFLTSKDFRELHPEASLNTKIGAGAELRCADGIRSLLSLQNSVDDLMAVEKNMGPSRLQDNCAEGPTKAEKWRPGVPN